MEFEGRNQFRVACPFQREACNTYHCAAWRWVQSDYDVVDRIYENSKSPEEKPKGVGENWKHVLATDRLRGYWVVPDLDGVSVKKALRRGYCGLAGRPYSLI